MEKEEIYGGDVLELERVEAFLPEEMEFNLSDFALFLSVMKYEEAHQIVLSILMEEPDLELVRVQVEEVILNQKGRRDTASCLPLL